MHFYFSLPPIKSDRHHTCITEKLLSMAKNDKQTNQKKKKSKLIKLLNLSDFQVTSDDVCSMKYFQMRHYFAI
jgi:hypothetical protein